ncbi:tryptophan-rich sensory protein [Paractinoplanes rhizophilus]|uniref:Tryptophan-rich sensory protein n=1 Tax=Paractinoplanes rhizophilus TaxID=1416877 RepID=A0ABW2HIV8_9ACTN
MRLPTLVKTSAAVAAAAVTGSLVTRPDSRWYRSLDKPRWQPPPAAFPIVWTALYGLLAVAGARALDRARARSGPASPGASARTWPSTPAGRWSSSARRRRAPRWPRSRC